MLLPLLACALSQPSNTPPVATLSLPAKPAPVGHTFRAALTLKFADGLHGYQNPPSDQFEIPVTVKLKPGAYKIVAISYPKGINFGTPPVKVYSGAVTIILTLKAVKKAKSLALTVNYQQCNESSCFPPSEIPVTGTFSVSHK
jgi:DsbC/DsbD-like thiol-disulfide interchange protein